MHEIDGPAAEHLVDGASERARERFIAVDDSIRVEDVHPDDRLIDENPHARFRFAQLILLMLDRRGHPSRDEGAYGGYEPERYQLEGELAVRIGQYDRHRPLDDHESTLTVWSDGRYCAQRPAVPTVDVFDRRTHVTGTPRRKRLPDGDLGVRRMPVPHQSSRIDEGQPRVGRQYRGRGHAFEPFETLGRLDAGSVAGCRTPRQPGHLLAHDHELALALPHTHRGGQHDGRNDGDEDEQDDLRPQISESCARYSCVHVYTAVGTGPSSTARSLQLRSCRVKGLPRNELPASIRCAWSAAWSV